MSEKGRLLDELTKKARQLAGGNPTPAGTPCGYQEGRQAGERIQCDGGQEKPWGDEANGDVVIC